MIRFKRNKTISHSEAIRLMEQFFEGETDMARERELYAYFAAGHIAPELQPYKEMMGWYADGLGEMSAVVQKERLRPNTLILWSVATAAMVALLISLGVSFNRTLRYPPEIYTAYQGSFIVRDGQVITDLDRIMPELIQTERLVQERMVDSQDRVSQMGYDDMLSDEKNIANLQRELLNDILSDFE